MNEIFLILLMLSGATFSPGGAVTVEGAEVQYYYVYGERPGERYIDMMTKGPIVNGERRPAAIYHRMNPDCSTENTIILPRRVNYQDDDWDQFVMELVLHEVGHLRLMEDIYRTVEPELCGMGDKYVFEPNRAYDARSPGVKFPGVLVLKLEP